MLTFLELSTKYLNWCKTHRAPRSYEWYENYISMFNAYFGVAETDAMELKPFQVQEWIDSHGEKWGPNYRGGAVTAIKRVYHWGEQQGHIISNPIKLLGKPLSESRKTFAKPEDVERILGHLKLHDPFHDFVTFLWYSFARPQEVRHIEARHVDLEKRQINFPAKESKGKRYPRCILIFKTTFPIIEKLVAKYPTGKLFRDSRGGEWSKFAICNRFARLSEILGKRITAYDLRHGIITAALEEGKGHMDIASASGHRDGSMIGKVYSHVHENKDRLRNVFGG